VLADLTWQRGLVRARRQRVPRIQLGGAGAAASSSSRRLRAGRAGDGSVTAIAHFLARHGETEWNAAARLPRPQRHPADGERRRARRGARRLLLHREPLEAI
jgi:hypothetical protein